MKPDQGIHWGRRLYVARRVFRMTDREFWHCGLGEWNALVDAHRWANQQDDTGSHKGLDYLNKHARRA